MCAQQQDALASKPQCTIGPLLERRIYTSYMWAHYVDIFLLTECFCGDTRGEVDTVMANFSSFNPSPTPQVTSRKLKAKLP